MQSLEEKVDIMLQNQGEIQDSIRKIRDVEFNILQTQGDILRTQYKMQEDIFNLKENQIKMQEIRSMQFCSKKNKSPQYKCCYAFLSLIKQVRQHDIFSSSLIRRNTQNSMWN